jgi:hypothetical protein
MALKNRALANAIQEVRELLQAAMPNGEPQGVIRGSQRRSRTWIALKSFASPTRLLSARKGTSRSSSH